MAEVIDCAYSIEGNGEPLVLIHGIGAARDAWRFITPHLHEHFTVVTYDLRGHGESPLSKPGFELDDLVDDLERLRDHLGLERMHLAGHSLGGMIGPRYALRFPERVFSLGLDPAESRRTEEDNDKGGKAYGGRVLPLRAPQSCGMTGTNLRMPRVATSRRLST